MKFLTFYKKNQTGFTLIELIVVMAVFLLIIAAAIGIFISIVHSQKKILSEQELLNQVSYVEEYMSKAVRMATAEPESGQCLQDLSTNGAKTDFPGFIYLLTRYDNVMSPAQFRGIKFLNQTDGSCQEFFLSGNGADQPYVLKELKGANGISPADDSTAVDITPSDLKIISAKFSIDGSDGSASIPCPSGFKCSCPRDEGYSVLKQCGASTSDTVQPRVTISLKVRIAADSSEPDRQIETTVSLRNLNAK